MVGSYVRLPEGERWLSDVYELENDLLWMTSSDCSEKGSEMFGGIRVDFLLVSDDRCTLATLYSGTWNKIKWNDTY